MADFIDLKLKQTVVTLADSKDYAAAANRLGITPSEVKQQIAELEDRLCLNLFDPQAVLPVLTDEGRYLIQAFREALARAERE